jgi:hypothetical protein
LVLKNGRNLCLSSFTITNLPLTAKTDRTQALLGGISGNKTPLPRLDVLANSGRVLACSAQLVEANWVIENRSAAIYPSTVIKFRFFCKKS